MSNALASSIVKKGLTSLLAAAALAVSVAAQGALLPRDINGDGIVDAYYDTAQNITWLADWNASGQLLTWDQAMAWAGSLNVHGVTGWRLPGVVDTGNAGCDFSAAGGTDCGYNVDTRTSELARLWYFTLGNLAFCARGEVNCGLQGPGQLGWGLTNTGPFRNMQGASYWTGTEYAADTSEAWSFATDDGGQDSEAKTSGFYAVAVHAGDVAPAPVGYKAIVLAAGGGAFGAGGGEQVGVGGPAHAVLWTGSADSAVDLHPQRFEFSAAQGTAGKRQVGYADAAGNSHAMLWRGSAASAVDLTPAGFFYARAYGIDLGHQAGYGILRNQSLPRALLWAGSAASAVDLHPSGFSSSQAWAAGDGQQVGFGVVGVLAVDAHYHALLWAGNAASVVDLNPAGFTDSEATGVAGGQQVGWARDQQFNTHAVMWTGSASSVVDLSPFGSGSSVAQAVAGGQQAGHVNGSYLSLRAMVWTGSAESAVNLHDFLQGQYDVSDAAGIDDAGNIVGQAGHIIHHVFGPPAVSSDAVLWVPVLPYGLDIDAIGSPGLVHLGDQITYVITVTNSRSGTATGVRVSDALPIGTTLLSATTDRGSCSGTTCNLDTLPGGSSAHVTFVVQLSQGFPSTSVNNSVSVSADNLITKSAVVVTPVTPFADLSIIGTAPATAVAGNNLTYKITVTNRGGFPATGVTVRDTLPGGVNLVSANSTRGSCTASATITCNIGTLSVGTIFNAGAWATVTIVVTPTQEGTTSNTATVAANEPDPNPANNSATQNTAVVAAPLPDLTGSWQSPALACKTRRGVTTCSITGKLNVVNQGTATAGACIARLYLSNDTSFSADDVLLGQVNIPRLQAGATKAIRVKPSLPIGSNASGKFLIAVLDASGVVTETDKSNNNVPSGRIP